MVAEILSLHNHNSGIIESIKFISEDNVVLFGISYEEWKIINTFAPWFSAFGTILAVIISLYLAYLNRKITLKISSNISLFNNGSEYFFIKVANTGYNSVVINNILLQYGLFKKSYIVINDISLECSTLLPTKIEVGDAITLCMNIKKENNILKDIYNILKDKKLYLGIFTLTIVVNTATGKSFKNRVSKDIMNEIHYLN